MSINLDNATAERIREILSDLHADNEGDPEYASELDTLFGVLKGATVDEQQAHYLAHNGSICPSCHSHDIQGDRCYADDSESTQNVKCLACHKTWRNVFTLTAFEAI